MDYQKSKIYSIKSHLTSNIYIGSTCRELQLRLKEHKKSKNNYTVHEILQYPDVYIELIENYPCNSRDELHKREGYIISINFHAINKIIAGRDQKESHQAYCKKNSEKRKELWRIWYSNNKQSCIDRVKTYRNIK